MRVDSIKNGFVIDHITAGNGMKIYDLLKLGELSCPVALMTNVKSAKMGVKDIIKIDADVTIDMDILGYVDPNVTIDIIKEEKCRFTKETYKCNLLQKSPLHFFNRTRASTHFQFN